ncbi:MAG: ribosome-associated translation inhibitor RaiA [Acidobacteriota bacterium]
MDLEFIARNIEVSEQQRAMARKKMARLAKYFNAVLESRLTVVQEKHRVLVEAFIRGKDFEVAARAETPEWTTSLQEAVDKLEMQARRNKQRLVRPKRTKAPAAPAESPAGEGPPPRRGSPRIVESRHVPVIPMTVEEAALQLEGSDDDFLVFREAESDRIHVLYRRGKNSYGLVVPDF